MRKLLSGVAAGVIILSSGAACAKEAKPDGKKLFEIHCIQCHKDGGNIINPQKTLKKGDLAKAGITKPQDIINKMRNPGPGMPVFDKKALSDKDAKAIAEYIQKTFK